MWACKCKCDAGFECVNMYVSEDRCMNEVPNTSAGPLTYRGVDFDKYGGVHYNGCAFENGGYREKDADDERRRYREVCIEKMSLQP